MMEEKQLEFLTSIEDIDWNSKMSALKKRANESQTSTKSIKLSKGQKKRANKKLKRSGTNTAASRAVETVVFRNPDARDGTEDSSASKSRKRKPGAAEEGIEIDLKQARFEVMKFGISSMKAAEKYDAETAFAISLGAKPLKKGYVNYKELLVTRKAELEQQREQELMQAKAKPKPKKTKKGKPKGGKSDAGIVNVKNLKGLNSLNAKKSKPLRKVK